MKSLIIINRRCKVTNNSALSRALLLESARRRKKEKLENYATKWSNKL